MVDSMSKAQTFESTHGTLFLSGSPSIGASHRNLGTKAEWMLDRAPSSGSKQRSVPGLW